MKKHNEKELCSLDEEMLLWTSYRYCIGRKTYVSSLAGYMAKKYYPILSKERLEHNAIDIRRCILNSLQWSPFIFGYEGTVPEDERRPLEDLLSFMTENHIDSAEKVLGISKVSVFHDTYQKGESHKYRVDRATPDVQKYVSQTDINNLIPWMNLASLFDTKGYKMIHVKYDGKEEDILAFESWTPDSLECEDSPGYYRTWPWHWKKVYVSVQEFLGRGEYCGYIVPEYIESVKDA